MSTPQSMSVPATTSAVLVSNITSPSLPKMTPTKSAIEEVNLTAVHDRIINDVIGTVNETPLSEFELQYQQKLLAFVFKEIFTSVRQ